MKARGIVTGICIVDAVLLAASAVLYMRQDRTAPVISFIDNEVEYEEDMDPFLLLEGVSAQDEKDGDVSDTLLIEKVSNTSRGDVIVTYAAMDSANNVAKASRVLKMAGEKAGQEDGAAGTNGDRAESGGADGEKENREGGSNPEDGQNQDREAENPQEDPENPGDGNASPQDGTGSPQNENGGAGQPAEGENQNRGEDNQGERDEASAQPFGNERGVAGVRETADNAGQNIPAPNGDQENQPEEDRQNQQPVLQLAAASLTVGAGSAGVDWNQCIGQLSDDTDSRTQLYANLAMEGHVDLATPGEYPVMLYTRDSEGAESARQPLVVRVE